MSLLAAMLLLSGTTVDIDAAYKPVKDQLAPARAGQVQCHDPDPAARTCRIMTWLSEGSGGRVQVRQLTALSDNPSLAAELRMAATREGDGLCGVVDEAYMAGFRIVGGRAPHAPVNDKRYAILSIATRWSPRCGTARPALSPMPSPMMRCSWKLGRSTASLPAR